MKSQIHPGVGAALIIAAIAVLGFFAYRKLGGTQVDTIGGLSPETKAKINATYGGGGAKASSGSGAPAGKTGP